MVLSKLMRYIIWKSCVKLQNVAFLLLSLFYELFVCSVCVPDTVVPLPEYTVWKVLLPARSEIVPMIWLLWMSEIWLRKALRYNYEQAVHLFIFFIYIKHGDMCLNTVITQHCNNPRTLNKRLVDIYICIFIQKLIYNSFVATLSFMLSVIMNLETKELRSIFK